MCRFNWELSRQNCTAKNCTAILQVRRQTGRYFCEVLQRVSTHGELTLLTFPDIKWAFKLTLQSSAKGFVRGLYLQKHWKMQLTVSWMQIPDFRNNARPQISFIWDPEDLLNEVWLGRVLKTEAWTCNRRSNGGKQNNRPGAMARPRTCVYWRKKREDGKVSGSTCSQDGPPWTRRTQGPD